MLGDTVLYGMLVNVINRSMDFMDCEKGSVVPVQTMKE
jgi:hypothetical protein